MYNKKRIKDKFGYRLTHWVELQELESALDNFNRSAYGEDYIIKEKKKTFAIFTTGKSVIRHCEDPRQEEYYSDIENMFGIHGEILVLRRLLKELLGKKSAYLPTYH